MATTSTSARPRGRPREFDRDAVLDRVMALFWDQGFEATSVADIVGATGLNKSSLYNTFGSKDALFTEALERYSTMRSAMMLEVLVDGDQGLEDIEALLGLMQHEANSDDGRRGCLAVNTSTELGSRDAGIVAFSQGFRDELRDALLTALGRAETAAEIAPGTAPRYATQLLSFALSTSVMARSGANATELSDHFAAMRAQLAEWRI